jgi:CRISPR-associated protein Csm4
MKRFRAIIQPQTAFITPLYGDTLFGQCCWALRHQYGETALQQWLDGYTNGKPFMVVSSAFIEGYINRPDMPLGLMGFDTTGSDRKTVKGKVHVPLEALQQPLACWHGKAINDAALEETLGIKKIRLEQGRTHNSINRQTGTTGSEGGFAPYDRQLTWYHPDLKLAIYVVIDESRISAEQAEQALRAVGLQGFGKEASSGLGKFDVTDFAEWAPPAPQNPNAWYTLAPCAPQGLDWRADHCYYQPFVRFGRHGDVAVHTGKPFKNPVMLAQAAAILSPAAGIADALFTGQGLGGVSKAIESTVQQGYAPVLPVALT